MRKTLLILIALVLAAPCYGQDFVYFKKKGGAAAPAGTCSSPEAKETLTVGAQTVSTVFRSATANRDRYAGKFTATSSYTLCSIQLALAERQDGDPNPGKWHLTLWADNTTIPSYDNQIGGISAEYDFDTITTDLIATVDNAVNYTIYWTANHPLIDNGVTYWYAITPDWVTNSTDFFRMGSSALGAENAQAGWENDTSLWTASGNRQFRHVISGQ